MSNGVTKLLPVLGFDLKMACAKFQINRFRIVRGLPFNIQGGGGRDIGMDQNIFFNMIQLMVIFFQLYGQQNIYFNHF